MLKIGLTGNFGMGKSAVLRIFRTLGAYTFDCDKIVNTILKDPGIIQHLSESLGTEILLNRSGKLIINKKRMADIIFSQPEKRKVVEKVIHPEVIKQMKTAESQITKKDPCALMVFEVPLLFEAGMETMFDTIVTVYAKRDTSLTRLLKKGFTAEEIKKRMGAQMPVYRKKERSDFIIDNSGVLHATELQVRKILNSLTLC